VGARWRREISIPEAASPILERLWSNGHAAYLVGGAVRDALLNPAAVPSVDIATDAVPERLLELFPDGRYENRFGMVRIGDAEVTTFRRDHQYGDHRRPDAVTFTDDVREDLARRDFTVNALAYGRPAGADSSHPPEFLDPTDGLPDLDARLLRAVGDPAARFDEDALRLLRAARFAAQLEFDIEPATREALSRTAPLVEHVSRERAGQEIRRMLEAPQPSRGFRVLAEAGILEHLIPELATQIGIPQNKVPGGDLWDHTLATVDAAAAIASESERRPRLLFAALLHDAGKPETFRDGRFVGHDQAGAVMAERILERLAVGRREAEPIVRLVRWHMFNSPASVGGQTDEGTWSDAAVRRFIRRVGPELVHDLFLLREADNIGSGRPRRSDGLDSLRERVDEALASGAPLGLRDLAVDGDDLKRELGLPEGPEIGVILDRLLEAVVTDPTKNTRARLLQDARTELVRDGRDTA
jgi:tRNA nucleotidyltransferase (CCA-adding enzyme)